MIGDGLRSRTDQRRPTEVDVAVNALNRTLDLGRRTESAHTSGRKSALNRPVEIMVRADRRCSWTQEQKRQIVAESHGQCRQLGKPFSPLRSSGLASFLAAVSDQPHAEPTAEPIEVTP